MATMTINTMQEKIASASEPLNSQFDAADPAHQSDNSAPDSHTHSDIGSAVDSDDSSRITGSKKRRDQMALVQRLLEDCKTKHMVSLDLSQKGLRKVPDELLHLTHLEYLYLEGNEISYLPENFFDCMASLQWLDLRNNVLQTIPSAYIGRHNCLRNLLLQGNQLRTLPLELGLVTTISGLNISGNPLEFPPEEVRERGSQIILTFLREVLKAKSMGKFPADGKNYRLSDFDIFVDEREQSLPKIEDLKLDSEGNSSEDEWSASYRGRKNVPSSYSQRSFKASGSKNSSAGSRELVRANSESSDLVGPVMHSASLQERTNYYQQKQQKLERLRRAGALGALEREISAQTSGKKKLERLSSYPEPPPMERVEQAYIEERRLAKLRELKEKQELILQRRRDQDVLKEWRDEGKMKQMKKHREKMIKGKIDYDEPARVAPYGISDNHLKMETNEERIARDIREKHEKIRRTDSPGELQKREEERVARDRELEKKLRDHTQQMHERRRKPRGTPQEEMLAAKRELEVAEQLQREIEQRRKALEYRFTAFTGDVV